jgi:hypothetical protein
MLAFICLARYLGGSGFPLDSDIRSTYSQP